MTSHHNWAVPGGGIVTTDGSVPALVATMLTEVSTVVLLLVARPTDVVTR